MLYIPQLLLCELEINWSKQDYIGMAEKTFSVNVSLLHHSCILQASYILIARATATEESASELKKIILAKVGSITDVASGLHSAPVAERTNSGPAVGGISKFF